MKKSNSTFSRSDILFVKLAFSVYYSDLQFPVFVPPKQQVLIEQSSS